MSVMRYISFSTHDRKNNFPRPRPSGRKFLKVTGQGTCEIHELFEQPAAGGR